jgi:hypothetical protein
VCFSESRSFPSEPVRGLKEIRAGQPVSLYSSLPAWAYAPVGVPQPSGAVLGRPCLFEQGRHLGELSQPAADLGQGRSLWVCLIAGDSRPVLPDRRRPRGLHCLRPGCGLTNRRRPQGPRSLRGVPGLPGWTQGAPGGPRTPRFSGGALGRGDRPEPIGPGQINRDLSLLKSPRGLNENRVGVTLCVFLSGRHTAGRTQVRDRPEPIGTKYKR